MPAVSWPSLKAGWCETVLFDRDGRSLITYGERGLFRWPIRDDPAAVPMHLRIGPPDLLRETTSDSWYKASWLPDGRTLAMLDKTNSRVLLVDTDDPHPPANEPGVVLARRARRMTSIAVSPDGRWAAAGGWNDVGHPCLGPAPAPAGADPASRRQPGRRPRRSPRFSPDGRWLVSLLAALRAAAGLPLLGGRHLEAGTIRRHSAPASCDRAGVLTATADSWP